MKNIFRFASLLAAAVMLFACEKIEEYGGNTIAISVNPTDIVIVSDKDVIQSNGSDVATIRVMLGKKDVTAESIIYDENNNVLTLNGGEFTATADGEYKFWAEYGTYSTYDSKAGDESYFVIKAIPVSVPESVEDSHVGKKSFVHRAFLTQYTGIGCGYCPYMIKILKELQADRTIPEKAVLAAVHSYSNADPAYIAAPKVNNYPFLNVDLVDGFSHSAGASALSNIVNNRILSSANAGISVNPMYYKDEGLLVVKVAVKAASSGTFNVGAWLLEDEIYGQQTDYDGIKKTDPENDYDTHESCVRVADSKYKNTWIGPLLGDMEPGDVLEKTFVMKVKKTWKPENLHLAVFASYGIKKGDKIHYYVCNVVDAPIDAPTPFEYK